MMTLKEAIEHCKEKALTCDNKECALDHFQLFKWLNEYQSILEKQSEQNLTNSVKTCKDGWKHAWSEEDEHMFNTIANSLDGEKVERVWNTTEEKVDNWLKSLKDRVQLKQEWSEEDEKNLLEISCLIGNYRTGDDEYKLESWLKSLEDRVQPMAQFISLHTQGRCDEIIVNVDEISSCHIEGGFSYTDYILILKNGTRYNLNAESYNKVTNLISE